LECQSPLIEDFLAMVLFCSIARYNCAAHDSPAPAWVNQTHLLSADWK